MQGNPNNALRVAVRFHSYFGDLLLSEFRIFKFLDLLNPIYAIALNRSRLLDTVAVLSKFEIKLIAVFGCMIR